MPIIPELVILNKRIKANLAYIVKFSLKKNKKKKKNNNRTNKSRNWFTAATFI